MATMVMCPGLVMKKHAVEDQPPADARVGEQGTCKRCGCRYTVVAVDPTVLGPGYDEYVMRLHEQVASLRRGERDVVEQDAVERDEVAQDAIEQEEQTTQGSE